MYMAKARKENNQTDTQNFRLSREDYELYLKLNQNLLAYAAQKLNPRSHVKNRENFLKLSNEGKLNIRNSLMRRIELIDEFVSANPCGFTPSELEIVKSWKNYVRGNFFLVDYRENGAVFLEEEDENPKAYLVLALGTPLWELVPVPPPAKVETVLLPFKGRIVYDGLVNADMIYFGQHFARSLRTVFDRSIMRHGIVTSLPHQDSVSCSAEEKLSFYLSTKERREENWEEIEELLENEKLLPTFFREMGKANSRSLKKRLKNAGVKSGWFAIANDVIVASGKTKGDLEKLVEELIPNHGKESVYIFEFK
jgi:hypothetical protein